MLFPNNKSRGVAFWGIGIAVGLLLFAVISKYYLPPASLEDTYKNIVKKSEIVSQLRINLLKSGEMEKSSVMAITDEESKEFADKSIAASAAVDQDLTVLRSLNETTPRPDEEKLLVEFSSCWTEYRKLDQVILDLAVQNTNLKAARLSRENGNAAMQRFEQALDDVMHLYLGTPNESQVTRLSYQAITAGLKIYTLHSSHIDEASDEKMDQIEAQMKAEENDAVKSLDGLTGTVSEGGREGLAQAKTAFTEFLGVTAKVITLSRENSNIKSLELSLGRKRKVATQCDEILATFQETVQSRTFKATR